MKAERNFRIIFPEAFMTDNSDEFDREEGRPDIPRRRKSYLKASLVFFGIGRCLLVPMLIAQSALLAVLAIAAGI